VATADDQNAGGRKEETMEVAATADVRKVFPFFLKLLFYLKAHRKFFLVNSTLQEKT
jgi:hypothetical protein